VAGRLKREKPDGIVTEHDVLSSSTIGTEIDAANGASEEDSHLVDASNSTTVSDSGSAEAGGFEDQGICEKCGSLSRDLSAFNGQLPLCRLSRHLNERDFWTGVLNEDAARPRDNAFDGSGRIPDRYGTMEITTISVDDVDAVADQWDSLARGQREYDSHITPERNQATVRKRRSDGSSPTNFSWPARTRN